MSRRIITLAVASAIVFSVLAVDQASKRAAYDKLRERPPVRLIGNFAVLTYAENTGAFLSMGARWPAWAKIAFLQVFPVILLLAVGVNVLRYSGSRMTASIGLALILGGGLGNLIDRILRDGAVIDFMNLGVGKLRTGIFNVADLAVMAGSAVLIAGALRADRRNAQEEQSDDTGAA